LLWSDQVIAQRLGSPPKFPEAERLYLLKAVRFSGDVRLITEPFEKGSLPEVQGFKPGAWALHGPEAPSQKAWCGKLGVPFTVFTPQDLAGFPVPVAPFSFGDSQRKRVIVTGCYDWFHSGHVQFFEEVSAYGDLYVIVGHDANIRLLKGKGTSVSAGGATLHGGLFVL
jgi:cytidyltransferase-like protein